MGYSKSSPKREIHHNISIPQKIGKNSHKLTSHLKELDKEWQIKPTPSRRRELIKIRAELNEIETRRTVEQINKTRSWFFERINEIDKPLASLIKKKKKLNKITNERGEITTYTKEIQTVLKTYYEQLYANKLGNLKKWMHFWKNTNYQN